MNKQLMILAAGGLIAILNGCSKYDHSQHCLDASDTAMVSSGERLLTNVDDAGLALQGYDPVAYFSLAPGAKPVKGDPRFTSTYRGGVYQFSTAANKTAFDGNPARFEPQFGGWCGYAASINNLSPIGPEYWEIIDGRLVLQHNSKAWRLWHEDVAGNLKKADANWPGLIAKDGYQLRNLVNVDAAGVAIGGYDPVAYFTDSRPLTGDAAIESTYQGATYRFASASHKALFDSDPERYAPRFGGFCGYAASINKVSPVNPEIWQIVDGRLVLQHTQEAYRLFNKDAQTNYHKAEQNWPGLTRRSCNAQAHAS
jgi:YHS domain-containing protein